MGDLKLSNRTEHLRQFLTKLYWDCIGIDQDEDVSEIADQEGRGGVFCPKTFDGYLCWPRTAGGQTVSQKCPSFVTGFSEYKTAFKTCQADGTWFVHPESGNEWSNYTTCIDVEDLSFRHSVNYLYVTGYSISLFTLVISLIIFFCSRSLKCIRIQIHIQLFLSLAFGCVSWIVWYKLFVENPFLLEHSVFCIGVYLLNNYLMLTNYFWMFCEGLHLHLILVVVFIRDNIIIKTFYVIGWVLPLILTLVYIYLKVNASEPAHHCWIDDSQYSWVFTVPVTISLLVSLWFLINVIRVLFTKLNSSTDYHPPPVAIRKAVRATLILFPLFGLQHFLLPLRPEPGSAFEQYYQVFSAVLISGQGFYVSCLFCFLNHEVMNVMRSCGHQVCPHLIAPPLWESVNVAPTQSRDFVV